MNLRTGWCVLLLVVGGFLLQGDVASAQTLKYHRFRFFLQPALAQGLTEAQLKARLTLYVRDLNTIFSKQTVRRFTFNPDTDITLTDQKPQTDGSGPNGTYPEDNYEIWAHAQLTTNPTYGTNGGYGSADESGAGVAAGLYWDAIHDPAIMDAQAAGSWELQQYWRQIHHITHELEHVFGAGVGEYYNILGIQDRTGFAPYQDLDAQNPADPYWSKHTDYTTDPLVGWQPSLSYAELMNGVRFANVTVAVINNGARNRSTMLATLPDLTQTKVWVKAEGTGAPVAGATVRAWKVSRYSIRGYATLFFEGTSAADGSVQFDWDADFGNTDHLMLIKVEPTSGLLAARWYTIYDAQEQKLVYGKNTLDIDVEVPVAPTPEFSIGNSVVTEGDSGTVNATFTVSLWPPRSEQVTVNYATGNVQPALQGLDEAQAKPAYDYSATSGTLVFAPGETTKTIVVEVQGDTLSEYPEVYAVWLSNATNAAITRKQGIGTIIDDDPAPELNVNDINIFEGSTGVANATFNVTLSYSVDQPVTVQYSTANGTAIAPDDFAAVSNTLTFNPGETSKTVTVAVVGDTVVEPNETFNLVLSDAVNARIIDGQGKCLITDDDAPPGITVNNLLKTEGTGVGGSNVFFIVRLDYTYSQPVSVNYTTTNDTAVAPDDYNATSGTLTFNPGELSKGITVVVQSDLVLEPTEKFNLMLSNPVNGTIIDGLGVCTITDDDPLPYIKVNDINLVEGNSGTSNATFTVTMSYAVAQPATVAFATINGTAVAPEDYVAQSDTLTFNPGETSKTVTIAVNGDTKIEPAERFGINLSNATNATILDSQGVCTIGTNDVAPTGLSVDDVSVTEGAAGTTTTAVFTVRLNPSNSQRVTVKYGTSNGTSSSKTDYIATSGTLTFNPGETTKTVAVTVKGDSTRETNETFKIDLSRATGASIGDSSGVGTIVNDD